jgi:hypothetical protein
MFGFIGDKQMAVIGHGLLNERIVDMSLHLGVFLLAHDITSGRWA